MYTVPANCLFESSVGKFVRTFVSRYYVSHEILLPCCFQASYAMGYNLAIEYLADYEKTWMLDSFRSLDTRIFTPLGRKVDWIFLEVHAEGGWFSVKLQVNASTSQDWDGLPCMCKYSLCLPQITHAS